MVSALLPLRAYQRQAIDATNEWLKNDGNLRCAIVLPTGGGKTVVFSHYAKEFLDASPDKRVLVLVHTDELIRQAKKKILDVAPHLNVGVVKGQRENEVSADVIVASVMTLKNPKRLAQVRSVGLIIVDECHHAVARSYMTILNHFEGVRTIGFTATLVRGDDKSLGLVWQDVTFSRNISWMVRKGFLIPPKGRTIRVPSLDLRTVKATRKDFREGELGDALVEALAPEIVARKYAELAGDRKGLLFAPTVASAQVFADAFADVGIKAGVIHGGLPQGDEENPEPGTRAFILDQHRSGVIQVLCNCMVLTEGYDDPEIGAVVVARPTKSKGLYVQMVGRGLRVDQARPYEEQDCLILDVVGASETNDLRSILDLSDRPLEPKLEREGRTLTELEDEFDAGEGVEQDEPELYRGEVEVVEFDPLNLKTRSKVWIETKDGSFFVPAGTDAYVFLFEYPRPGRWSVSWISRDSSIGLFSCQKEKDAPPLSRKCQCGRGCRPRTVAMTEHRNLDLEIAMSWAEDLATDLGAVGLNTAGKEAPWRAKQPSERMIAKAEVLGIRVPAKAVDTITGRVMSWQWNAGKVSDHIVKIEGTQRIDPVVRKVRSK